MKTFCLSLLFVIILIPYLFSKNVALVLWKDAITYDETLDGINEYIKSANLNINFIKYNAYSQPSELHNILNNIKISKLKYDAVLLFGTGALIHGYDIIKNIPVISAGASNPYKISGLNLRLSDNDNNITGLSYYVSMEKQIKFFLALKPDLNKVGLLYNSKNEASEIEIPDAENVLNALNIQYYKYKISQNIHKDIYNPPYNFKKNLINIIKNEIIKSDIEALIIPTNSEIIYYLDEIIYDYLLPENIVVFSFSSAAISRGAVASLISSNKNNGIEIGKKLEDILYNNKLPNEIVFSFPPNPDRIINLKMIREYDMKIDIDILDIANLIVE